MHKSIKIRLSKNEYFTRCLLCQNMLNGNIKCANYSIFNYYISTLIFLHQILQQIDLLKKLG